MYVQPRKGEGVTAYDVVNLTPSEMRMISIMDTKIADILVTHHPEFKGKKKYLSDDDLFKLRGILYSFAQYAEAFNCNDFEQMEKEIRNTFEQSHCADATPASE